MRIKLFLAIAFLLALTACTANQPSATVASIASATPSPILATIAPTAQGTGCSSVSAEPTAVVESFVPPITEADYIFGPADAPVTLV